MKKVVKYDIVNSIDIDKFLDSGWQPWGSPFPDYGGSWFQAIVRYEE